MNEITITVREILKQFELKIPLNEDMLNVKIHGDIKFIGYHTEYHHNISNNKEELVYVIEGITKYDDETRNMELIINPNKYRKGQITKEMIRYDVKTHIATLYNEKGHGISLKNYVKELLQINVQNEIKIT